MTDFYLNREIAYKWPPNNLELISLEYLEDAMPVNASMPDPDNDAYTWVIQGQAVRYRFRQIVGTAFTDVSSYKEQQRCIPRSPAHARTLAAAVSQISVSEAIQNSLLEDLVIDEWELVGHSVKLREPGIYEANFTLEAVSDYVWTPNNFVKSKQKTEYQLA